MTWRAASNPKDLSSHYAFGENWADYAREIDDSRIIEAEAGLKKLFGEDGLSGKTFLDVGCGSGIHSLAALRLGCDRVLALDIDPVSVVTVRTILQSGWEGTNWDCRELNVFDLSPDSLGRFDVVYSWGVLHHTGAMWEAVEKVADMVRPGGLFAIALYHKNALTGFWTAEKRVNKSLPPALRALVRWAYISVWRLEFLVRGRDFGGFVAEYKQRRGMSFYNDVDDWLGGYPYESTTPAEVDARLTALGFQPVRAFTNPPGLGLWGAGNDEFVYRRVEDMRRS